MSKILLIGAGAQGGPCASILSRDKKISEIVLGDINLELAKKVSKKIGNEKITTIKLDASKTEEVEKAAKGADAVINLTLTAFDMNIMKATLRSGAHYIDTSFGEPDLMDIRARDNILSQIRETTTHLRQRIQGSRFNRATRMRRLPRDNQRDC
jgi:saccharopine dehydrogenase-like NADP-dependent oxidoreductase